MHANLRKLESELHRSLAGLSAAQTQATPTTRPEAWNAQEIIEHLLLTYRSTVEQMETRISKGRPVQTPVSVRMRLGQLMVITLGRFPTGFESPKAAVPSRPATVRNGEALSERVSAELERLDGACRTAETMFGAKRSVTHFRLGPLSIAQWRRFHLIHGLHHRRQIDAIRREHGFSAAGSAAA